MNFRRVIKVGGSLFDDELLSFKLTRWLGQQSSATNVLVAGGGGLADTIREWARRFSINDVTAHWMCVDLLASSSTLLTVLLPEAVMAGSATLEDVWGARSGGQKLTVVFNPVTFLKQTEASLPGVQLPQNWSVTSDSIAARIAVCFRADELVLLKSIDVPIGASLQEVAEMEIVDDYFPQIAGAIQQVRFVNLRDFRL